MGCRKYHGNGYEGSNQHANAISFLRQRLTDPEEAYKSSPEATIAASGLHATTNTQLV